MLRSSEGNWIVQRLVYAGTTLMSLGESIRQSSTAKRDMNKKKAKHAGSVDPAIHLNVLLDCVYSQRGAHIQSKEHPFMCLQFHGTVHLCTRHIIGSPHPGVFTHETSRTLVANYMSEGRIVPWTLSLKNCIANY